jgi:hypothetical protein
MTANFEDKKLPTFQKSACLLHFREGVAGVAGLEPATPGFGDRCSSH